jgi:hypothetical protein
VSAGWEEAQRRLVEVLAERSRQPAGGPRRAQLDDEVAALAAELGLDTAEVDDLAAIPPEILAGPPVLHGRFLIRRRARDVMPFYIGLLLVPIVAGLGASAAAGAGAAVLVVALVVHHRRRLARFDVDALGRIDVRHAGRIDWDDVDAVSFRIRYPWLSPRRPALVKDLSAVVRFQRSRSRDLRLAQGPLWQIRPVRRPLSFDHLGRHLRDQARAAGLTVERLPGRGDGWTATRRARPTPR